MGSPLDWNNAADLAEKMHELVSSPQLNPSYRAARSRVVRGRPSSGGKSMSVFVRPRLISSPR
jgi:hypothetical protein